MSFSNGSGGRGAVGEDVALGREEEDEGLRGCRRDVAIEDGVELLLLLLAFVAVVNDDVAVVEVPPKAAAAASRDEEAADADVD